MYRISGPLCGIRARSALPSPTAPTATDYDALCSEPSEHAGCDWSRVSTPASPPAGSLVECIRATIRVSVNFPFKFTGNKGLDWEFGRQHTGNLPVTFLFTRTSGSSSSRAKQSQITAKSAVSNGLGYPSTVIATMILARPYLSLEQLHS